MILRTRICRCDDSPHAGRPRTARASDQRPAAKPAIRIDLAHNTEREQRTKTQLDTSSSYDLRTLTRRVTIEERAINHAFPI